MAAADDIQSTAAALLPDIRRYLDITWADEELDKKIQDLTADGIFYLNDKLGEPGDYTVPGYPRQLLKEYVRYARDAALDVFENNDQALILAMGNNRKVSAYVESTQAAGE